MKWAVILYRIMSHHESYSPSSMSQDLASSETLGKDSQFCCVMNTPPSSDESQVLLDGGVSVMHNRAPIGGFAPWGRGAQPGGPCRQTVRQTVSQTGGQTDRQSVRQADMRTDSQTDRKANTMRLLSVSPHPRDLNTGRLV